MATPRFTFILLTLLLYNVVGFDEESIKEWAEGIGEHLWQLGKNITREADFKKQYKAQVIRVHRKDPDEMLDSIMENVKKMLQFKMNAVKCIQMAAEDIAEQYKPVYNENNFTYNNAKYSVSYAISTGNDGENSRYLNSTFNKYEQLNEPNDDYIKGHEDNYNSMMLEYNKQFYNIPVNTSYSSVHVPTNVYDFSEEAVSDIEWSKQLDEIFMKNYQTDPSLSWQYFGHSSGVMRTFPALHWKDDPDLYDCRTRSWYIEAATCSKDIIFILDNSGSMTGMRYTIAKLTLFSLLDTVGNNDFINVFYMNDTVYEVVTCYNKEMLVQATEENIKLYKDRIDKLVPLGPANFTYAFAFSFNLLKQLREERGCGNSSEAQCSQAIVLVTDGLPGNLTDVFEEYNRENNSYIPVRIFAFLIGREVTNVREIQWLACLNRGYYSHIQYMYEVREQVFKYINVIARPLILQGVEHPIAWTHAYVDTKDPKVASWLWEVMDDPIHKKQVELHARSKEFYFSQNKEDRLYIKQENSEEDEEPKFQKYHMMTSVSSPAFDRKSFCHNESCDPKLLGVAGIDVPLDDLRRLLWPYKIGVNGYPFVISNNGYLLVHPDLRPVFLGILKDNYNSVDLTEVEFLNDGLTQRELNPQIVQLREAMVNYTKGSLLNLTVKFHYDDMKRVGSERRDYYFIPLPESPYTLGIVLPQEYGHYHVKVDDRITYYQRKTIPLTKHFTGSNWKIHPDWLYCRYHYYGLYRNISTPELELLHFLKKLSLPNWKWSEQYDDISYVDSSECFRRHMNVDDYYCDRELMQLLFTDAIITDTVFQDVAATENIREFAAKYDVTLRFVSTHSGLTRWQHLDNNEERIQIDSEFGDFHPRAIEESWYKAAVLQHQLDPNSFAFSVPLSNFETNSILNDSDIQITASHAIFPRDGGMEAPASVVGFQFLYSGIWSIFSNISIKNGSSYYKLMCESELVNCYILDNNGYVVLSEDISHIGLYFGEAEGPVVKKMVDDNIYSLIRIYDYQALCARLIPIENAANFIITPFQNLLNLARWALETLIWLMLPHFGLTRPEVWDYYDGYEDELPVKTVKDIIEGEVSTKTPEEKVKEIVKRTHKTIYEACDQKIRLILLEKHILNHSDGYRNETECSRHFFVQHIPHTNLILVVTKDTDESTAAKNCGRKYNTNPKEFHVNNSEYPCQKINTFQLYRRKLTECFSYHPEEQNILACGNGPKTTVNLKTLVLFSTVIIFRIFVDNT